MGPLCLIFQAFYRFSANDGLNLDLFFIQIYHMTLADLEYTLKTKGASKGSSSDAIKEPFSQRTVSFLPF